MSRKHEYAQITDAPILRGIQMALGTRGIMSLKDKIVRKVNSVVVNRAAIFKYRMYNLFRKKCGINTKVRDIDIIVSLTTYPKRIDNVFLTIESLLNQTVKPDKIILWLSREEIDEDSVPNKIKKLQNRGLSIKFTSTNLKSYGKLIHALDTYENSLIITIDDDAIHPRRFIAGLLNTYKKHPDCIIAYRCSFIKKLDGTKLSPYTSWAHPETGCPSFNLFPTGLGGILYPPNSLNQEVFNSDIFLNFCPLGDDIWFKAMALLNGTRTAMVYNTSVDTPTIPGSQKNALWHKNVTGQKNDEHLKNIFDLYNLYKYLE